MRGDKAGMIGKHEALVFQHDGGVFAREVHARACLLYTSLPIGGFITLGCLIALMQYALRKSAEKKEAKEKALAAQEKEAA